MPNDLSDDMLMQRYCDGDLPAFQELYRRHSAGLYRFLAWRAPRREWVDEVAQDSWIALHHARASYSAQASFRTYLFQIARNRLIDLMRQHQLVLASDMGQDEFGAERFDQLADLNHDGLSPEAEMIKKQQVAGLHAAISALPGEQKEALILQQFNGMSLEEIAQLSDVPVETVKSRLRYAMRKLRESLVSPSATREEHA
jgi:RNA polymerase sigma-70 factor (ECF subfamily)